MSRTATITALADRVLERFTAWVGRIASYGFLIIVAITTVEVVLRYVFRSPTIWVHEISVMLAAVAFVVGGPLVHQHRRHITISYFYDRMPAGIRRWVDLLTSLLVTVFLGFLAWTTVQQAWMSWDTWETSGTALNLPIPLALKTLFAACVLLMLVQTLLHLTADVRGVAGSRK